MSSEFSELINITNDHVERINIFYNEFKEIEKELKTSYFNTKYTFF